MTGDFRMKKISIIIPVHNAEKTLDLAVQSVLRQTLRRRDGISLEVILVDDGSSDASGNLCDRYRKEPQPEAGSCEPVTFRVIHMEDEGVSEARNRGLELSEGDFITFLDADDAMEPGMLECLYELHERTGASICGCGFRSVTPEEARAEEQATGIPDKEATAEELPRILNGAAIVKDAVFLRDTRVWSKLFTKELIGDRRFQKGLTIGEDMLFVVSLIREDTVYALLEQEKLYRYTVNPKGAMERPFTPSYMDQIRCWEEAERALERNLPELLKDKEARARLGALQIVSDVLTASKIAKLPKEEQAGYEEEFRLCRDKLLQHRKLPGAASGIPFDYRIKSFLLGRLPGIYRRLYE